MNVFLKALALTCGMFGTAITSTIAVMATTHSVVSLLVFPITLFLSLLAFLMNELEQQRR